MVWDALTDIAYERIRYDDDIDFSAAVGGRVNAVVVLHNLRKRPELNFRLGLLARYRDSYLHPGQDRLGVNLFTLESLQIKLTQHYYDKGALLSIRDIGLTSVMSISKDCLFFVEAQSLARAFCDCLKTLINQYEAHTRAVPSDSDDDNDDGDDA